MLEIQNLRKTFLQGTPNERRALDGLSLHLEPGEFVTILGSNGAGKSTLFAAIAGEFLPDSGTIELDGKDITYQKEHLRARMIGRLFQDPLKGTAPDMTIEENLALAGLRGNRGPFSPAVGKKDAAWLREQVARLGMGLEDRMKTRVGLLSGGQRQAITLLMSTLSVPRLLLLDEHTAALDPVTAEQILAVTREIVAEHRITTLMITHNITSALSVGARTIMLDRGRVVLDLSGSERAAMTVPKLMERYRQQSSHMLDSDRMLLS
ncbi:MAG: ATP-binding cassette domain-containing protein [Intestinimonas sp.]|jgi:putative ABC transport system ATP-binding protein|nr:ATP-binding cassette domain-containing protein [Intestinimonas sp.]